MSDSEHKVLAGILPDLTARMEKAQIRLIDKFNFENQAFRELWELLDVYYDDHMAIMPEWYLKDRALQSGMDPAKVLSLVELYKFLSSVKVNEHEFDAALQILKDDELTRKTAEALVTAREILQGEYYDDKSDKILRGQDNARAFLTESLQHMETAGAEAAPEGDMRDDMEKLWAIYLGKEENPDQAAGIKYGIHELDECTGGVRPGELVLVAGFTGEGKASPLSTPVLTPRGWEEIGNLQVGDIISSPTGGEQKVLGVHDRGVMKTYRVTTADGGSVLVAADHLWQIQTNYQRIGKSRSDQSFVVSTQEIMDGLALGRRYYLPVNNAIEFQVGPSLPVGAYALGAFIGDGSLTTRVELTSHTDDAEEVLSYVTSSLTHPVQVVNDRPYRYRFIGVDRGDMSLYRDLQDLGVCCKSVEKSIPRLYMYASIPARLELLQGLMDTDGTVSARGTAEFSTSSPQLADDVRELAQSLGGIVGPVNVKTPFYRGDSGQKVEGHEAYSFTIQLPSHMNPFKLVRKAEKVRTSNRLTKHGFSRVIRSVVEEGQEEVRCISVSDPDHLYITKDYLVTHNSHLVASLAWNAMRNGKNVVMFTTETTREEMEVRILARHSRLPKFKCPGGIDSHEILSGTLSQEHKRIFRETIEDFKALDAGKLIMVQMPANGSVDYVHAKANQYNRSTQVDLIVIDSINLLRASRRYESKREMLEDILQDFKRFASSFDGGRGVAVVSPWQMSRTAWKEAVEAGGTYTLASLADTSEAEKPLRVTTPVLTPTGWVPLGDLTPGDSIIDPSTGGIQKVTKFIDRGKDSLIRLNFQDGTFSDCSPDHLWYVRTTWNGNRPLGWMTITAGELKDRLDKGYRFATPIMKAPNLGEVGKASLTIPPYALGLLLGDGGFTTKTVTLTSADPQVVEEFRACLPPTLQLNSRKAKYQYGLAMTSEQRATGQGNPWIVELRRLGLFGVKSKDKFVPEDYKWASAEDRLALFQGYMDADGEATFKDTGFSTGSEALSKDMRWIAASLGIKISKERIFQPHYTHLGKRTAGSISYRTSVLAPNDMDIFRLERKRARRRQREDDVPLRYVESAEYLGEPASVACIQVSGESKLFVIDGFVVTHNCLPLNAKVLAGDGFVRMGDISPGDKITGADSELQTVLDVHDNGVLPILEVVTQDGRVIECTPGHIWTIMHEGSVYNVEASQLEPYLNEAILPSLKTAPLLSTEGTKGLELLDPKYLAAMLREKSPVAGSLSVTTDDVEHLNQAIPTLPQYALAYSKEPEELTFIYSATSLAEDPHLLTYQEAGLLSGDITKFRIPEAYQTAHPAIREALVLALAGNPSGRLARLADRISILSKLPYDHPGFGEDLKELVWSLGLSLQGDLPRIVEVRKTTRLEETRCITVSNPDGLFVTDHFVITHNSASQIITIFKGDGIGEPGRVNIQALKHRSGSEMPKVSYPIDYRNSYIGSSNEVSQNGAKQPQAKASMVQDISNMLGL